MVFILKDVSIFEYTQSTPNSDSYQILLTIQILLTPSRKVVVRKEAFFANSCNSSAIMSGTSRKTLRSAADKGKGALQDLLMGGPAPGRSLNLEEQLQEEYSANHSHDHTPVEDSDEEQVDIDVRGDLADPKNYGQGRAQHPPGGQSTTIPATQASLRNPSEDGDRS